MEQEELNGVGVGEQIRGESRRRTNTEHLQKKLYENLLV